MLDGPFAGRGGGLLRRRVPASLPVARVSGLGGKLGHIDGDDVSPESIEEVLSRGDYESFVAKMEGKVHDDFVWNIRGFRDVYCAV